MDFNRDKAQSPNKRMSLDIQTQQQLQQNNQKDSLDKPVEIEFPNSPMKKKHAGFHKPKTAIFQSPLETDDFSPIKEPKTGQRRLTDVGETINLFPLPQEELPQGEQYSKNKIACKSEAGTNDGVNKKINQDSFIAIPNFILEQSCHLFGVMDGHGNNGHFASQLIKNELPVILKKKLQQNGFDAEKALTETFETVNKKLMDQDFDTSFSGSTCNIVLIIQNTLYCANAGDSRSFIVQKLGKAKYSSIPLSEDHKPDNPKEKLRIEKSGGEVRPLMNKRGGFYGPHRVWIKGRSYPGLAMSRSMGDQTARKAGVIEKPDIIVQQLDESFKYFIMGSDGLYEFLENEDILKHSLPYYKVKNLTGCCDFLIKESSKFWLEVFFLKRKIQ